MSRADEYTGQSWGDNLHISAGLTHSPATSRYSIVSPPLVTIEMFASEMTSSAPSSPTQSLDNTLLSPPVNTFTSRPRRRPGSAPPVSKSFNLTQPPNSSLPPAVRSKRLPSSSEGNSGKALLPPPPPLFRPTTFWRNTRRSGVTGASYSPSSHLIRRSTFVAAGLSFEQPIADLSAFGVESRIGCVFLPPDIQVLWTASSTQYYPRQDTQAVDSTTSSFNWWPYPSWGADTTVDNSAATTATAMDDILTSAVDPSFPPSTTTLSPSLSTTAPVFATGSSASLIHITALPPANSSSSNSHRIVTHDLAPFNAVYLAPVFVVVGILLGVLSAWSFRFWTSNYRRSRTREGSLEPGPRYTPTGDASPENLQTNGQDGAFLGHWPSKRSTRSSAHSGQTAGGSSWLSRAFTSRRYGNMPSRESSTNRRQASTSTGHEHDTEDDPFIEPPASSRPPSRFVNALTSPLAISLLSDDDEDTVPYDTLRHKSIRRGILERLKFGTIRHTALQSPSRQEGSATSAALLSPRHTVSGYSHRPGHKRADSDFTISELKTPSRAHSLVSTPKKAIRGVEEDASFMSGPGFRIIEEDTEAVPAQVGEDGQGLGWDWSRWPLSSPSKMPEDKFTPIPTRRSTAEKRLSPHATPVMSRSTTTTSLSTGGPMTRVDSSVLPQSPPQLMSPPLETQLFFGPIGQYFASSPQLSAKAERKPKPPTTMSASASTPHADTVHRNKIHTQRQPPRLPFPSSPNSSPYRSRLMKPLPKAPAHLDQSKSTTGQGLGSPISTISSSPPRSGKHATPADRYNARRSALDKVEEIILRSWSEREINGASSPGIPPIHVDAAVQPLANKNLPEGDWKETISGTGIDQRLAMLGAVSFK